ncbi:MAG: phage tail protein [Euryarchaeota archaeon]|nr:phage tail protein [Euryarchaeota archaeon]MBU4139056.1 phage tail protein [Euryarchaeota archaeon]
MAVGNRKDPYGVFRFRVEIEGIIAGGFSEVSGLSIQTEVESIREGGVNDFEYKLPKGTKYSDITLKRGLTDWELYNWYMDVINGKIERKSGAIYLLDQEGKQVMDWYFFEAFPVKWEGSALNAASNTVVSETLILTHHGLV